jgi:YfiR/HmsC-like
MRRLLTALVAVLLFVPSSSHAALAADSMEYKVKAAFLFNFLKFVEWPSSEGPIVIGILGQDPFGTMLDETVRGKAVGARSIEVRRFSRAADVKDCQMLFIGHAEFERAGPHPLAPSPGVLVVGESPAFIRSGGAINFYLEDNRVRFEINAAAAKAVGLRISAQLLKLGRAL